jgi:hypothetical protein
MTKAQIRALIAVQDGLVTQVYDRDGNVFCGPPEIAKRNYRVLEIRGLIEDAPGQKGSWFKQQLTVEGRAALQSSAMSESK